MVAFELHAESTSEHRRRRQYWFQGRPLHRDDMLDDCRSAVGTVSTECGKDGLGQNNGGSIQADGPITSWPPDGLAAVLPGRGQGRATSSGPPTWDAWKIGYPRGLRQSPGSRAACGGMVAAVKLGSASRARFTTRAKLRAATRIPLAEGGEAGDFRVSLRVSAVKAG